MNLPAKKQSQMTVHLSEQSKRNKSTTLRLWLKALAALGIMHFILMCMYLSWATTDRADEDLITLLSAQTSPQVPLAPEDPLFWSTTGLTNLVHPVRFHTDNDRNIKKGTQRKLKWALFTPPKPYRDSPYQMKALDSWLALRNPPNIFFFQAGDLEEEEMMKLTRQRGIKSVKCKTNAEGLILQNSLFEEATKVGKDMDAIVVINSDIILGDDFVAALGLVEGYFERFLMVGARFDNLKVENMSSLVYEGWIQGYRNRTLVNGALHTYGGSDYFAWRPVGDPATAAIGGGIPPFTYGRGKADNWIIHMAIESGVVQVVDASTAVLAIHPAHGYKPSAGAESEEETYPVESATYTNHWSQTKTGDPHVDFNKHLAYTFGSFLNGQGTPLHAPWELTRCIDDEIDRSYGVKEKACLRRRVRPGTCPCAHNPTAPRTLTEIEVTETGTICGHSPVALTERFEDDFILQGLVAQQAVEKAVVLLGFNNGYQSMLLNMICRLRQLKVSNYIIAAFDPDAYMFCREHILPCFPVSSSPVTVDGKDSSVHEFGSQAFRALTKLKSQQVLRILTMEYHVLWSDVDIFWKVDTIPLLVAVMGDEIDIAVQSNAPLEEEAENGIRRINSGFYYVKSSAATIAAFTRIVGHARASSLSEQPSFYTILCGDGGEHVVGMNYCVNDKLPTTTLFLPRDVYPNGAMGKLVKDVTRTSKDKVAIVHFNWRVGHDVKVQSFVDSGMWLLGENNQCLHS